MYPDLEKKLHEIAEALFAALKRNGPNAENPGLLSGQTGVLIFCKHYLHAYPNAAREKVFDACFDRFCDSLTSGIDLYTYCSGLAGILEGLKYLNERGWLEVDYSDIENHYREHLYRFSLSNFDTRNYDFLHGALGVVKFFRDDPEFVNQALDALEKSAEKDGRKYRWVSRLGTEEKYGYNISLSHGISSIVSVLSLLTASGTDTAKRDRILTAACSYILSQEIDPEEYGCHFPSMSLDNAPDDKIPCSRLAWCYGDLGVAASLWQAGRVLDIPTWREKAREVFRFSAGRRDMAQTMVQDAGLCHGAAGVAMMFHYMYGRIGDALFSETRDYWLTTTWEMSRFADGIAGYKVWRGSLGAWKREYSLLEGVAGIGLMLLTALAADPQEDRWMNLLLLN